MAKSAGFLSRVPSPRKAYPLTECASGRVTGHVVDPLDDSGQSSVSLVARVLVAAARYRSARAVACGQVREKSFGHIYEEEPRRESRSRAQEEEHLCKRRRRASHAEATSGCRRKMSGAVPYPDTCIGSCAVHRHAACGYQHKLRPRIVSCTAPGGYNY